MRIGKRADDNSLSVKATEMENCNAGSGAYPQSLSGLNLKACVLSFFSRKYVLQKGSLIDCLVHLCWFMCFSSPSC